MYVPDVKFRLRASLWRQCSIDGRYADRLRQATQEGDTVARALVEVGTTRSTARRNALPPIYGRRYLFGFEQVQSFVPA